MYSYASVRYMELVCGFLCRLPYLFIVSSSKNSKKTLIPTALGILYDNLSLKNDVNVASKSNKQKNFFVAVLKVTDELAGSGSGSISRRYGSANPDPYQKVADLQRYNK